MKEIGRKIDSSIENPIDNVFITVSDKLTPIFRKFNYTPNGLTTISLILALTSYYHLYNYEITSFSIYFILSYLFDCMDGYYARKYNMISEFGDYYDHFADLSKILILMCIIYSQYNITDYPIVLLILCCLFVIGLIYFGCNEQIANDGYKSTTLGIFKNISPNIESCHDYVRYLKYFGSGTWIFVIIIAVIYLNDQRLHKNILDISHHYL